MTRNPATRWSKEEAASDFARLLEAANEEGPQTIVDGDRIFEVRVLRHAPGARNNVLDEPGPLTDDEHKAAFGSDSKEKD